MINRNLLPGRDKELQEIVEQYEKAKAENAPFYLDADEFSELTNWYGFCKEYTKAAEVAKYGLKIHPNNTAILIALSYLILDEGLTEKASKIAASIKEQDLPEVKVLHARILLSIGAIADAERIVNSIEEKGSLDNMIEVAYMYLDAGYSDKAMEWLRPGRIKYADDKVYMATKAETYYAKGMDKQAALLYNKLIDKEPYSAPFWFGLSRCYYRQEKYDKAIEACDFALIGDDEYADAYVMKGHCFDQLGNEDAALAYYKQAQKYHGIDSDFIYSYLGLDNVIKGEWKEGYENLDKVIKMNPNEKGNPTLPGIYANAGLCLFRMGKKREAHQYCQKAQFIALKDPCSYLIEGRLYVEEGDYQRGFEQWERAAKYSPTAETWHEIGMHSMEVRQVNYAKKAFEKVRKLNPEFEGINEKLTIVYLALHDLTNFMKYNEKCSHPIDMEKVRRLQDDPAEESQEELAQYIDKMLKELRNT